MVYKVRPLSSVPFSIMINRYAHVYLDIRPTPAHLWTPGHELSILTNMDEHALYKEALDSLDVHAACNVITGELLFHPVGASLLIQRRLKEVLGGFLNRVPSRAA